MQVSTKDAGWQDSGAALRRKLAVDALVNRMLFGDEEPLSCLMINLPGALAHQIQEWVEVNIQDEDLYVDEEDDCRGETETHVTLKFGLLEQKPSEKTAEIIQDCEPFDIKLTGVGLFRSEKYDVVWVGVESPGLHALNRDISAQVPVRDTFSTYNPHVTVAYVQKGTADHLKGQQVIQQEGKLGSQSPEKATFQATEVVFSSGDRTCKKVIPLGS